MQAFLAIYCTLTVHTYFMRQFMQKTRVGNSLFLSFDLSLFHTFDLSLFRSFGLSLFRYLLFARLLKIALLKERPWAICSRRSRWHRRISSTSENSVTFCWIRSWSCHLWPGTEDYIKLLNIQLPFAESEAEAAIFGLAQKVILNSWIFSYLLLNPKLKLPSLAWHRRLY